MTRLGVAAAVVGVHALGCCLLVFAMEDVAPVIRTVDGPPSALAPDQVAEEPLTAVDKDHWAFHPLARPAIPSAVTSSDVLRTDIDSFILARLEKVSLSFAPQADRATLLRRLTFDLTGLPPTPAELAEFLSHSNPDSYEQVVDRLLSSPSYGERWSQHWLDLARFAETDGFEHDKIRPDAWKFRDWVIAAINEDLPYNQFVMRQIAGDQLSTADVATMFCLSGPDMPDINDQVERRHLLLNEMTSTVGSVFLGLQMGCAECHDHKYDPISQNDFYRLRAVFESAVPALKRDAPYSRLKQQSKTGAIPSRFWVRGDHRRPGPYVDPGFPRIASDRITGDAPGVSELPRVALAEWLVRPQNPLTSRVIVNRIWKHHFGRGLFDTPSDLGLLNPEPTHPELLDWLAIQLQEHGWSLKWLHRQIVCSAAYRQASHATSFDSDWHRRLEVDPENRLISRKQRQRLDGESLRDAMLSIAGLLTQECGGPGVMPPLPDELVGTLLKGQWVTSPRAADHDRRSVYLFCRRNLRYPLFEAFDRPDANASCAARNSSTTAPQSLLLLNSQLSLRVARCLAGEILRETNDPDRRIDELFVRVFSRHHSEAEANQVRQFLSREQARLTQNKPSPERLALPEGFDSSDDPYASAAWVEACLAFVNASELLYVD